MSRKFPEQLRRKRVPVFGAIHPDPGSPIADLVLASLAFAHPQPPVSMTKIELLLAQLVSVHRSATREGFIMFPVISPVKRTGARTRALGLIDSTSAVRLMLV
jgi:hypothetical protein